MINIEARGHAPPPALFTTIALQDGAYMTTSDYPGGARGTMGRCLTVRRLAGPFGFAWLRINDAAPPPPALAPGQLSWPIEPVSRADCFSRKPLSALGGKA